MPGRIPQEKIDQIRESIDIVDTISRYLTLKKRGKYHFGCCPFHQEKTPSFSVDEQKQIFYCFGCGKGGNVYTFLMEHDKIGFVDAVRQLARQAGIPLEYDSAETTSKYKEKEALLETVRFAARFFYYHLTKTKPGQTGMKYLLDRQLSPQVMKTFGLGYAPNLWDGLLKAAQKQSINPEQLEKCGLIISRKNGPGFYDRFRNRVIFPVFDATGRVVAFGARRLAEDNTPKYINSPETLIYQKREVLYGLSQTRQVIQAENKVLMVEGYMDLISLYQAGIQNVVATSGTALTAEHAKLISRYTKNVVLLYDGDSAGSKAALRGLDVLLVNDLDVLVAQLTQGEDPDTFVKSKGTDAMQDLIKTARPLVEFKLNILAQTEDLSSPAGQTKAIHSILDSAIRIKDEIKQSITIREVAERFNLDERILLRELEQLKKKGQQTRSRNYPTADTEQKPVKKVTRRKTKADRAEIALTKLLIRTSALNSFIFHNLDIRKIKHPVLRELVEIIYLFHIENKTLDRTKLISYFEDPKIAAFITQAMNEDTESQNDEQLAGDCIVSIEKRDVVELRMQQEQKLREMEKNNQDATIIIAKIQKLNKLIQEIEKKKFITDPKKA